MVDFLAALRSPGGLFLRNALITGVLSSVAFGIIGTYVVARRISYMAGAISHCVLGGIGAAVYLGFYPMLGALVSALVAAGLIGLVSMYAGQREDTVIGAIWAVGMAIGLLFSFATPGYQSDLMSYLFGDINLISPRELWAVVALDVLVVALSLFFYNKFLAVCFDEEFALLRGVHVQLYYMLLLCLTALTVVLLVSLVGIVMVIALLTLPAAVAGHFARRIWQMMALASLLCMLFVTAGIWASFDLGGPAGLPTGPVIIVIAGGVYLLVAIGSRLRSKLAG